LFSLTTRRAVSEPGSEISEVVGDTRSARLSGALACNIVPCRLNWNHLRVKARDRSRAGRLRLQRVHTDEDVWKGGNGLPWGSRAPVHGLEPRGSRYRDARRSGWHKQMQDASDRLRCGFGLMYTHDARPQEEIPATSLPGDCFPD
jgi:hypothetical protein